MYQDQGYRVLRACAFAFSFAELGDGFSPDSGAFRAFGTNDLANLTIQSSLGAILWDLKASD